MALLLYVEMRCSLFPFRVIRQLIPLCHIHYAFFCPEILASDRFVSAPRGILHSPHEYERGAEIRRFFILIPGSPNLICGSPAGFQSLSLLGKKTAQT
jgi:hypothetical protein